MGRVKGKGMGICFSFTERKKTGKVMCTVVEALSMSA